MIALLHKLDSTLEVLRRKIGAAQDAISRLEEDIKYVQRKLGIIPYTYDNWRLRNLLVPHMFIPQIWDRIVSDHVLDAAKYGMVGITAKGTDKVKIVRPPDMYFGMDWARKEGEWHGHSAVDRRDY